VNNNVYIMGACDFSHFLYFYRLGYKNFLIDNNPASFKFVTMGVIKKLVSEFPSIRFIFSEVPKNKEEYKYYNQHFKDLNISLRFIDDINYVAVDFLEFCENAIKPNIEFIILDTSRLFIDDRTLNGSVLKLEGHYR